MVRLWHQTEGNLLSTNIAFQLATHLYEIKEAPGLSCSHYMEHNH